MLDVTHLARDRPTLPSTSTSGSHEKNVLLAGRHHASTTTLDQPEQLSVSCAAMELTSLLI